MQYLMKSGQLFAQHASEPLAQIKNLYWDARRVIHVTENGHEFQIVVRHRETSDGARGDVRLKSYVLMGEKQAEYMKAQPGYAAKDNPDVTGWPICRAPRVNHAKIQIGECIYLLLMHNSQYYEMVDARKNIVLQIIHGGMAGGWRMETREAFSPAQLCALFIFCRYMEQNMNSRWFKIALFQYAAPAISGDQAAQRRTSYAPRTICCVRAFL